MPYKNKEDQLNYMREYNIIHKEEKNEARRQLHQIEKNDVQWRIGRKERHIDYRKRNPEKFKKYFKKTNKKRADDPKYKEQHKINEQRRRRDNYVKYALSHKRNNAKAKNLDFNLTEEWYLAHFSQGCEMTGKDFIIDYNHGPWSPEIDRIDPANGYTMDNCRIVCRIYNVCKNKWTDKIVKEFIQLLK